MLIACCADRAAAQLAPDAFGDGAADFDAYVERVRTTFDVPGIAVALVRDDAVVLERGYGVRKLGEPARVDAQTLFAIA